MRFTTKKRFTFIATVGLLLVALSACNMQAPEAPAEPTATTFAFPTATEAPATGSVTGLVWQDQCQPNTVGGDELPQGCRSGYSHSRTCEIGLSKHAQVPYRSIVHLVDACTSPAGAGPDGG